MTGDRAVSMPLQYVLLLAVIALLSSGLFISTSGFVQTQQQDAVRQGLEAVGYRLASDLSSADRLAATLDESGSLEMKVDVPRQVSGSTYLITFDADNGTIRLESTNPTVVVTVPVVTGTERQLASGTVSGGPLTIHVKNGTLVVHND